MNPSRRRFVGQCATVASTSAVSAMVGRIPAEAAQTKPLHNWAGNHQYSTNRITSATSLAQVQDFVRKDHVSPHLMITELRAIATDDLWMGPCYKRPSLAIDFTWKQDWPSVRKVLPMIERELAPFEVRPHWGKLFTIPPAQLQRR